MSKGILKLILGGGAVTLLVFFGGKIIFSNDIQQNYPQEGDRVAVDIANNNNKIFLADGLLGLQIFTLDKHSRANPVTIFKVPGRQGYSKVIVAGPVAYLASFPGTFGTSGNEGWLDIVDFSNPSQPNLLGKLRINGKSSQGGVFEGINNMVLSGSKVYLTDNGGNFEIIDVSNPEQPVKLSEIEATYTSGMRDLVVNNNYVYTDFYETTLTASKLSTRYGIRIVDVSNPSKPTTVKDFETVTSTLTSDGKYLYLSDGNLQKPTLTILDITIPTEPKEISKIDTARGANKPTLSSGRIFIPFYVAYDLKAGEKKTSGVLVIDTSNISHPLIIKTYKTHGFATKVIDVNDLLYIADGNGGLSTISKN